MSTTKLILGPIQNLHDARYAAAVGIDYLVFNTQGPHAHPIAEVIQMRDWLSGPQIIVRFGNEDEGQIREWMDQVRPAAIILPHGAPAPAGACVSTADGSDLGVPCALAGDGSIADLREVRVLDTPQDLSRFGMQPTACWLGAFTLMADGLLDYEACDAFLEAQSLAT